MSSWTEQDLDEAVLIPEGAQDDPSVLNTEFEKLPAQTAYWSSCYSQAVEAAREAKVRLKNVHSELVIAYAPKYPRRDLLSAAVNNDARRKMAEQNWMHADRLKTRLWGVLEGLKAKREALITIGANLRSEQGSTNTSIRSTSATERMAERVRSRR